MLAAAGGSQPPPGGGGNDQHHAHHYSLRKRTNLKRKKTADGTSDIPQGKVAKPARRTPPVSGWVNKKNRSFVKFGVKTVVVHKLYTGDKKKAKGSIVKAQGIAITEPGEARQQKASETGQVKGKGKGKEVDDSPDPDSDLPEKEYGAVRYSTRSQSQPFSESTSAVAVPDGRQERGPNLDGRDDSQVQVQAEQVGIAQLQMDNLPEVERVAVQMLTILRKHPPRRD